MFFLRGRRLHVALHKFPCIAISHRATDLDNRELSSNNEGSKVRGLGDRMADRKPYQNINFVIAHDGFTLYDLVSYNQKRNQDNGEQNKDGSNDNVSWNCGFEGETQDAHVLQLRRQQMRNLMVALLVSQGTPMVLAGALPRGPVARGVQAHPGTRAMETLHLCSGSQTDTRAPVCFQSERVGPYYEWRQGARTGGGARVVPGWCYACVSFPCAGCTVRLSESALQSGGGVACWDSPWASHAEGAEERAACVGLGWHREASVGRPRSSFSHVQGARRGPLQKCARGAPPKKGKLRDMCR